MDPLLLERLRSILDAKPLVDQAEIKPYKDVSFKGNQEDFARGKKLIEEGVTACLLAAGGQGTRLGFEGPKGMFPVSVVENKTLFQLFSEKVLGASEAYQTALLVAIMTSPQNDFETQQFFKENHNFGLPENSIDFFCQSDLPLLDHSKNFFQETKDQIARGPDGNGGALHLLVKSGIFEKWKKRGVKYIQYLLVDNPLSDPFDAEFVGFQERHQADVAIKAVKRDDPSEKVGMLVKRKGQVQVVEYSEFQDPKMQIPYANISVFGFSTPFVEKASERLDEMPLHVAHKAVKYLNEEGVTVKAKAPNAWKFERFIFDVLPFAKKVATLVYPREECYAPLKDRMSLPKLQAMLQEQDKRLYRRLYQKEPPDEPFELNPGLAYCHKR